MLALAKAMAAVDLAYSEPARARRMAGEALAGGDPETVSVAERALGMVRTALGKLPEARQHFQTAVRVADRAGLATRAAEARGSLAYLLTLTGHPTDALAQIERAAPVLTGQSAARLRMQRALVLTEMGRFSEAAGGFDDALDLLAKAGGNELVEAGIRNNRSILSVHRRDWRAAEEDLRRAEELFTSSGHAGMTSMVYHNRGLAAALRGDVPAALAAYDEAEKRQLATGQDVGVLPVDRAEVLLSVRLVAEARAAAEQAVIAYAGQHNAVDLVRARLLLAKAALLDKDFAVALTQATRARRAASRQHRPAWAALAGYLALRARWEAGDRGEQTLRTGQRVVTALTDAGWVVAALDARLVVARTALHRGRPDLARRALAGSDRSSRNSPAELRARIWHARALLRLSDGDSRGAATALRAGMLVLERFRASVGARELRAHVSGHASELAELGMSLALESETAPAVLAWAERWRAGSLMLRPARPPDDAALAGDLAELRQVTAQSTEDSPGLLRRQAALEESIRRRAHHTAGNGSTEQLGSPSPARLSAALGPAALIEYLAVEGKLHAVVLAGGRLRLRRLGALAPVELDLAGLRHGLRRVASQLGTDASRAAAAVLVEHRAARLDEALLRPLRPDVGDRPLVLVPTGALHAMPWSALPSCFGRPVSVAPSAALWHRAATAPGFAAGRPVFAAGPGLPHATAEVVAIARRHPGARRFTGRNARVDAVRAALDDAPLAHLAAHGHFRADNPLFSAIRMADGPLTVYDLERLTRPPRHVVLSACDSGLPSVRPGDEPLGLASALLALGTRSLIAAVVPVADDASRPLMLRLHHHLRRGEPPAVALATAAGELGNAAGFLCFGAG